jgi:hypothetical protein
LVEAALDELGLVHRPLPLSQLYGLYNRLRRDVVVLLDLQNALAQKQYMLAVLRAHKEALNEALRSESDAAADTKSTATMAVDDVANASTSTSKM